MDIYDISVIQSLVQANDVFWVRSADYATQLYVSDSYTKIWEQPVDALYQYPNSFNDSLLPDETTIKQVMTREKGQYIASQQIAYKIQTRSGIKYMTDICFDLYHCGEKVAVAGIAREVDVNEWASKQTSRTNHLAGKDLDVLSQVADKLGVALSCTNTLEDLLSLLSKRQKECLHYTLLGQTAKEVAKQLNISHKTVEMHLSAVREKLFCHSKSELICKVIEAGYFRQ